MRRGQRRKLVVSFLMQQVTSTFINQKIKHANQTTIGINSLDSTAVHVLHELLEVYKYFLSSTNSHLNHPNNYSLPMFIMLNRAKDICFLWANVKSSVMDTLEDSGLAQKFGLVSQQFFGRSVLPNAYGNLLLLSPEQLLSFCP